MQNLFLEPNLWIVPYLAAAREQRKRTEIDKFTVHQIKVDINIFGQKLPKF